MTIHIHCFVWGDESLLPHFFRRHEEWADHFHVWNLESGDGQRLLLDANPRVTVHSYRAEGTSVIDAQRQRFNEAWKISRGRADWVVLLDADEHLHHPDLRAYLGRRSDDGVTAIKAIGYEMLSDRSPQELEFDRLLCDQITQGCRSPGLDRLAIFSPGALTATNFAPGQHYAWPEGHVVWPAQSEVLLLRFQVLSESYFAELCKQRAASLLPDDIAQRWGAHLNWSDEALHEHVVSLRERARAVPGLGDLSYMDPADYRRDERIVEESGLFDADWYEGQNPDIAAHQFDPLTHYCEYGWREGRPPNPYFDGAWYVSHAGEELPGETNPLLHYIQHGAREDREPSPYFDPKWYRQTYLLDDQSMPLAHYLQHRSSGLLSPKEGFDVEAHVSAHPHLREYGLDPYLHHLAQDALSSDVRAARRQEADAPVPDWEVLLAMIQQQELESGAVPMAAVEDVIRQFLPWLPFDAQWYEEAYPDVAEAIAEGAFESAHSHFVEHGFFEGRRPVRDPDSPE